MRGLDVHARTTARAEPVPRPAVHDDQALMACVAGGDRHALESVYTLFAPLLMAVAARMLGGQREAQDLVHDVILEAWMHAAEFDARRGSLRSWLLLRLRSRALDRLGRAEAVRTRPIEDADEPDRAAGLPTAIEHADRIGLQEAVERLDGGVREALELTYFRGLTAEAIAQTTGVPVGTVRSRIARGLRVLRQALGGVDGEALR